MDNHHVFMELAGFHITLDELAQARKDKSFEASLVSRYLADPNNGGRLSQEELEARIHDYVHVAKHYIVTDGPARPIQDLAAD